MSRPVLPSYVSGSLVFAALVIVAGASTASASEGRCANHDPLRQPYYGDFHVHTGVSMDAYAMDQRSTPDTAYAFASGAEAKLPPLDAQGNMTRTTKLDRPLDFAAVTDHAEFFGELRLCIDPESPVYATQYCNGYRGFKEDGSPIGGLMARSAALFDRTPEEQMQMVNQGHAATICGEGDALCLAAARDVWAENQAATERWNDTTDACRFATFHAYEYSLTPRLSKIHRNVVFGNATVPAQPISAAETPEPHELWRLLAEQCLDAGNGCDVVAIPHNSNLSNGQMFRVEYPGAETREEQAAQAALRARVEPLVEMMQIKGDSECANGMWKVAGGEDEFCAFEKFRIGSPDDCEDGMGHGALAGRGCRSRNDFARYALVEGLRERERIGVNPFKFGFIASTDTHNGNPGDVEEDSYPGSAGARDAASGERLGGVQMELAISQIASNPGGLVGIWAEENSRESLFAGMKRRETFGTSGTRIAPRLFGSWDWDFGDGDPCATDRPAAAGYAAGVPMGSDLPARPEGEAAPSFLVSAARDPGTDAKPGTALQRIQIIKGWAGEDGVTHQRVFDVAGGPNDASVDLATCRVSGPGHDALCSVWVDPEFDASQSAVYYARVLENPSCRYNAWECSRLPEGERPEGCSDPNVVRTIQERAWTSPIWYEPAR